MLAGAGGAAARVEEDFAGPGWAGFGADAPGVSAGLTVGAIAPAGLSVLALAFTLVSVLGWRVAEVPGASTFFEIVEGSTFG